MQNIKVNRGAILRSVEQGHIKQDHPDFQPGDTVRGYLVFIVHSELTPEVLILRSTVDSPGQQIEIPSGQPA